MHRNRSLVPIMLSAWTLAITFPAASLSQEGQTKHKYAFVPGKLGYTQVLPDMNYTKERGFGFDLGGFRFTDHF